MINVLCSANIDKAKKEIQQYINAGLTVEEIVKELGVSVLF